MLCFLPLTLSELTAPNPPRRDALVPKPAGKSAATVHSSAAEHDERENQETLEADTRDDAAFISLELAREQGAFPTRLVVSFNLPVAETQPKTRAETWDAADSIFVDDRPGRSLSAELVAAQTQEEADALAEALYEEPLMWFDASEREELVRNLLGEGAV